MAKLITEASYNVELYEDKKNKNLYVVGIFSTALAENNNKRKYKKETLEREVGKVEEKIKNRCLWGELSHPSSPEINPERISHLVEKLEWKHNDLFGRAKVLDTPMGNIAKTLVSEGKLGISSRGLGTVSDGWVNEDYKLITYDLVTDPSNGPSWVDGILEDEDFEYIKKPTMDEAEEAYKKHIWQVLEKLEKQL